MPAEIVGLDLSLTATGICVAGECDTIRSRSKGMDRLHQIRMEVLQAVDAADLVVIEGYSFSSRDSHAHALGELGGIIRYALWDLDLTYVEVPPASVKQFATGKGNANKDAMVATAARLGCPADDNNAVDAWWLYQMGSYAACPCVSHPSQCTASHLPPTNYRETAIRKVAWPALTKAVLA